MRLASVGWGLHLGGAGVADGGGGGVLLVVHVEDHDDVHRARKDRVVLPHLRGQARWSLKRRDGSQGHDSVGYPGLGLVEDWIFYPA